jgi:ligand-binding sensor domain-containing protein
MKLTGEGNVRMLMSAWCWAYAVVFAAVLIFPAVGHAQQPYFFNRLTTSDGLSDSNIDDLFLDSKGFLWVTTANGLNRYDGYEFRQFHFSQDDTLSLPTGRTTGVSEDSLGRIWVGCWGGLARFDPATGIMQRMHLDVGDPGVKVRSLHCDRKGRVWLAMEVGLFVFDLDGKRIKAWPRGALPDDVTVAVYEDHQGRIWAENKAGPCLLDEETLEFRHFPENNPPYLKNNGWIGSTIGMEENPDGTFYHGSWANGLKHFDPETGLTRTWLYSPQYAGHGAFNVITAVRHFAGQLWVASHDKGLGTFDPVTETFTFLSDLGLESLTLPTRQVMQLLVAGNILWIATDQGLYSLDRRKQLFSVYNISGIRKGSCYPDINHVAEVNGRPDSLLITTMTCGLFDYSTVSRKERPRCGPVLCPKGQDNSFDISTTFIDSRGVVWFPTHQGMVREEGGIQRLILAVPGAKQRVSGNCFLDVLEGDDGDIWAATLHGIVRFPKGGHGFERFMLDSIAPELKGKVTDRIVDLALGPNGDVWAVRDDYREEYRVGLTVFRRATGKFESYCTGEGQMADYPFFRTSGTMLELDSKGRLWCATQRGLAVLNGSTLGVERVFTTTSGLHSDLCESMCKTSDGRIWVSTRSGISIIDPTDFSIKNLTAKDGFGPSGIASITAGSKGRVYLGHGRDWLSIYDPSDISWDATPDRLTVTSVETSTGFQPASDRIEVPHDFGFVRIAFSPLNYLPKEDNRYRIVISGGNGVSDYVTSSNELTLSGIAPGRYQIGITPVHPYLTGEQEPWLIGLIVVPAYYQTGWFKLLLAFLLLGGAALGVWLRFRALRRQQEKELQLNWKLASAEMNALRSQMSPHFIFNALNAVNRFIWAEQPKEASNYLIKFSRLTRRVLENSREQWISLSEDVKTLRAYLELESVNIEHGLDFSITVADDVDADAVQVPPMLLQPFVENALKHGLRGKQAKGSIVIHVAIEGHELKCTIEDDGVGRSDTLAHVREGHTSLGTKITAERIEVINALKKTNARFSYVDKKDSAGHGLGTIVILYLPLVMEM